MLSVLDNTFSVLHIDRIDNAFSVLHIVLDMSACVLGTSIQVFGYGQLGFGPKGRVMSST